ncbi:MAG: bifunctional oligoribonuclease/PAP phosphatase NrnA [Deltaproteobacteria bacterium]|nr:bifunctional oligoribonuclease/PAP phosphatase NrnA [Deltaproteobacteria bacterium]
MENRNLLISAFEYIRGAKNVAIIFHKSPDGDCVGSAFGLYHALKKIGKESFIFSPEPLPFNCAFLNRGNIIRSLPDPKERFDLTVVLDLSEPRRIMNGIEINKREIFGFIINIDHHITGSGVGDLIIQDPDASATAEIIYRLLKVNGIELDSDIAEALYTAIITDTGSFRYSNTTPKILSIASELLTYGLSPWKIAKEIYESEPKARVILLSKALSTLTFEKNDRIAYMRLTINDIMEAGATDDMTDQFVNYARSIKGVDVGLLFREVVDGKVKVSLRSKDDIDVATFALKFGGGGHKNASGIVLSEGLDESVKKVISALNEYIK